MQALAITYLIGQADEREVGEFRRLYATDAGFRERVTELEAWLAPLNETSGERQPPPGLLEAIMQDVRRDMVAAPGTDETPPGQRARPSVHPRWRTGALAAAAVALVAIGANLFGLSASFNGERPDTDVNPLIATLTDDQAPELIAIVYDPATRRIVARLTNTNIPKGQSLQLWLLRDGEDGPRSLGLLTPADDSETIAPLSLEQGLRSGTDVLAVSLEAEGGTREGSPQGPILFSGSLFEATSMADPTESP